MKFINKSFKEILFFPETLKIEEPKNLFKLSYLSTQIIDTMVSIQDSKTIHGSKR